MRLRMKAISATSSKKTPKSIPVYPVGVGSNLLVRNGGVRGVVIRLGAPFAKISVDGTRVSARRRGARCAGRPRGGEGRRCRS